MTENGGKPLNNREKETALNTIRGDQADIREKKKDQ